MIMRSQVIAIENILPEADRIEAVLLNAGLPAKSLYLLDIAADLLVHNMTSRARALGIEVCNHGKGWSDDAADWEPGDPVQVEVFFSFPDEDNAVWFRTMIL